MSQGVSCHKVMASYIFDAQLEVRFFAGTFTGSYVGRLRCSVYCNTTGHVISRLGGEANIGWITANATLSLSAISLVKQSHRLHWAGPSIPG